MPRFLSRAIFAFGIVLLASSAARTEPATYPAEWDQPKKEILEAWRIRREVVAMGQDRVGARELERIRKIQMRFGLTALPTVSLSLLSEARDDKATGSNQADPRVQFAEDFSPNMAALDYAYCGNSMGSWLASLERCFSGLQKDLGTYDGKFRWASNFVIAAFGAYLLVTALFALMLLSTYVGPVTHHWAHRLKGFSRGAILLILGMVFFLSWVAGGWMFPFLLLLIFLWRYLVTAERVFATLLLLLGAAIPFALLVPAMEWRYETTAGRVLEQPLDDSLALAQNGKALRNLVEDNPNDADAMFVLAQIERRTGRMESARDLLTRASNARPQWYKPLVNLATLDYLEHSSSSAITHLQKAIAIAPKAISPHFNLGKVFYKETRLDEGLASLRKAKDLDPVQFARLDRLSDQSDQERYLIDESLDDAELIPRFRAITHDLVVIRNAMFKALFPMLSIPWFFGILAATWVLAIGLTLLLPSGRLPRACEKCGLPSCALCDPAVERESLCVQCYHIFVRLESVDPEARSTKDRAITQFRFWRDFRSRWVGFLIPGTHALFRGNYLRAFILLFLTGALCTPWLASSWLLSSGYEGVGIPWFPYALLAGIAAAVVYALSILDAVRG